MLINRPKLISPSKWVALLLSALILAACATMPPPFSETQGDQWQAVSYDNSRIGHRQVSRIQTPTYLLTKQWLRLRLLQPGTGISNSETLLEYTETNDGKPISIKKQLNTPSANYSMSAFIDGDTLLLKLNNNNDRTRYPLPANFLLPEGRRLALLEQTGKLRSLNYSDWNFTKMAFESFDLVASKIEDVPNSNIQKQDAVPDYRWKIHRSISGEASSSTTVIYADASFFPLSEHSQSAGKSFSIETCSKNCALSDFVPQTHVYRQVIRSPYRISEHALAGKIRYHFAGPSSLQPPTTRDQNVDSIADGWQITVCKNCNNNAPNPTPAQLNTAMQSNYWLAADNDTFKTIISQRLGKDPLNAEQKMQRLTRLVTRHMSDVADYVGYATALEAWQNQTGDCTEHALLLATLGKAAGIPTRVVLGLAYNNERFLGRQFVFVPHAWVQAWTGERWQNFDSALGEFNAGYITLGVSQGEPSVLLKLNEKLHLLELRSAVQLRSR